MAKQSLFYEEVIPITVERHNGWSVEQGIDYAYASKTHSVPLMYSEFRHAGLEYPIVFGKSSDGILPLAMLGMQADKSLFVSEDGKFLGKYVPAFIRRYPFIFARSATGEDAFALCVDETYVGLDKSGKKGDAFFQDEKEPSDFLKNAMEFSRVFEIDLRKTKIMTELLEKHELLDPMQAQVALADGNKVALTGFFVVSRERLRAISEEVLKDFFERELMELIYIHLLSLKNIERLRDMVVGDAG